MMVAIGRSLRDLAESVPGGRLLGDALVSSITHDSRKVTAGTLFCCVPGAQVDGHVFAPVAIQSGATALLVERELVTEAAQFVVPSVRAAMGPIAATFHGDPSASMQLIGVTGTNGKTTTTYMLEAAAKAAGVTTGVIGTIETRIADLVEPVAHTTPESVEMQELLARMRDAGVGVCAMEVSSHGLEMGRVDGCRFAAAVFTNLTQDHLDFHANMEEYFEAKALLFDPQRSAAAVINIDDAYGARITERVRGLIPTTTYGFSDTADIHGYGVASRIEGSSAKARIRGRSFDLKIPMTGSFNVLNALAVLGVASTRGWDIDAAISGIGAMTGVPGRLERVDAGQDFTVLVDYAHTPDSLEHVLNLAKQLVPAGSRLITVFGCGGDRDRTKRPLMGAVGARIADLCVITSDNPRSEDPASIVAEISKGASETGRSYETIVDRAEAISFAIQSAKTNDVIVIAGKGHETGQKFADRTIPFDDRLVARAVLEEIA